MLGASRRCSVSVCGMSQSLEESASAASVGVPADLGD